MSYPRDLDEIPEEELLEELARRKDARKRGVCDYCGRSPSEGACCFQTRHTTTQTVKPHGGTK